MIFCGIGRVFSTVGEGQYETIGAFWQEMSEKYEIGSLRGLGFNWTDQTIEYVIGLKNGIIEGANRQVELPDQGWKTARGRTEELSQIYNEIYRDGPLRYEIETFTADGACEILYYR